MSNRYTYNNLLQNYQKQISAIPRLNSEEEIKLTRQIKKGNQEALDNLIKANLWLVLHAASQYKNKGLTLAELIHEGNLGLIAAGWRYKPESNCRFYHYSIWWVHQAILRALSERSKRNVTVLSNFDQSLHPSPVIKTILRSPGETGNFLRPDLLLYVGKAKQKPNIDDTLLSSFNGQLHDPYNIEGSAAIEAAYDEFTNSSGKTEMFKN